MRLWVPFAILVMIAPTAAFAQYKDLDTAMSNLTRGFGSGEAEVIVAGIAEGDKVQLQFPGLVENDGFFGKDQATYLLDGLFNKVQPDSFEQMNTKKVSSEQQYHITAKWTIKVGGNEETRDLYITLKNRNARWSVASIRSGSK